VAVLPYKFVVVEFERMVGRPVYSRGVHHGYQTIRRPGQQLVTGGTLSRCKLTLISLFREELYFILFLRKHDSCFQ
jgi:hypothetical protein